MKKTIKSLHKLTYIYITFFFWSLGTYLPLLYRRDKPYVRRKTNFLFVNISFKLNSNLILLSLVWSLFSGSKISPMKKKMNILKCVCFWNQVCIFFALLNKVELKCPPQKDVITCHFLQCTFPLVDKDFFFFRFCFE